MLFPILDRSQVYFKLNRKVYQGKISDSQILGILFINGTFFLSFNFCFCVKISRCNSKLRVLKNYHSIGFIGYIKKQITPKRNKFVSRSHYFTKPPSYLTPVGITSITNHKLLRYTSSFLCTLRIICTYSDDFFNLWFHGVV